MKQVDEFKKMFKVTIPVEAHHEYYIETLAKASYFAGIPHIVSQFEELERYVDKQGFKNVFKYKMSKLDELAGYIKSTKAYERLQEADFSKVSFEKRDYMKNADGVLLISIDFTSANFNALKLYDEDDELFDNWHLLCDSFDIHKTLISSKSFRQIVFGNTNPKRLQTTQKDNIYKVISDMLIQGVATDDDIVFISHDEVIFQLHDNAQESFRKSMLIISGFANSARNTGVIMPTHYKIFRQEPIANNMKVHHIYEQKGSTLIPVHKTLANVPGNKYFKIFKKHILGEPIEKRDLMFMNDNEIAIWDEEEFSIKETIVPEGEMTMEDVKEYYPNFYDKLKSIPGLNESQRRKIIDIAANLCRSCMNADADKCNCWRDE